MMQESDNRYVEAYNQGIAELNNAFANLTTLEDYQDRAKCAIIEEVFSNLYMVLDMFSDQEDVQVKNLRKNIDSMKGTYEQNYNMANEQEQSAKEPEGESLNDLINNFNREMNELVSAYNNSEAEEVFSEIASRVEITLKKIEALDADTYASAKGNYENLKRTYAERMVQVSATLSRDMSADERVREFRSIYISEEPMFRSINVIEFQDPSYRAKYEDVITKLQTILNPIREDAASPAIVRASEELAALEKIYADALAQSEELSGSVEGIAEELEAIQGVFNQAEFDSRLPKDYFSDDPHSVDDVRRWAEDIKRYQDLLPEMMAFLDKVYNNTLEGQSPEFLSYYSWFKNSVPDALEDTIRDEFQSWEHEIYIGVERLEYKGNGLEYELESQESVKEIYENLQRGKKMLANQIEAEKILYGTPSDVSKENMQKYEELEAILQEASKESLSNQKLSRAVSDNPELLAVARELIAKEPREMGEISHLRIVTDLTPRTQIDLMDNGVTKYFIKQSWEIFNVEFVERHGDKYYIVFGSFRRNIQVSDAFEKYGYNWFTTCINSIESSVEILKENLPSE